MCKTLSWYIQDELLYLTLKGQLNQQKLKDISKEIVAILDASSKKIGIIIDVNDLEVTYQTTEQLRTTQHYMNHQQLSFAITITNNKLNRLITLMAFSTTRIKLIRCENIQEAETHLKQRGLIKKTRVS